MKIFKFRKLVSLVIATTVLLTAGIGSFATKSSISDAKYYSQLTKLNVIEVKTIPNGIIPKVIKNESDLVIFAKRQKEKYSKPQSINIKETSSNNPPQFAVGSQTRSKFFPLPCAWTNVKIVYEYLYNSKIKRNYFSKVYGITSYISGCSPFTSYTPNIQLSFANISRNTLSINYHVEGMMDDYLLIQNKPFKMNSYNVSADGTIINP